eukprot:3192509-Pleurochrysis_carterae.AAC.1
MVASLSAEREVRLLRLAARSAHTRRARTVSDAIASQRVVAERRTERRFGPSPQSCPLAWPGCLEAVLGGAFIWTDSLQLSQCMSASASLTDSLSAS